MNFLPQYLLFPFVSLFFIGGGGEGGGVVSASSSLKENQQHQQQQRLRRGLLQQQQNNNNFDNNANESSRRRFSIELERDIEQKLEIELERQPRIIGGSVVNNPWARYPYFALMSGSALCGAVLIAPGFVVTAAHCAYADNDFQVSGTGNVEYDYASGRIHPDYDEEKVSNDLAIFALSQVVPSSVTPVKLRRTLLPSTTQSLTVIGFGDTDPSESVSETSTYLREVDLQYVSAGQCSRSFGGSWWGGGINISDGMLCAYNPGKDSCGGDSGGPLLLKGSSGRASSDDDELVGLVSWGISCADDGYPGVYTRVSYYYEWIVETMCELNPDPSGLPDGVVCDSGSSSSSSGSSNTGDGDGNDDCTYEGVSRSAGEYLTGSTLTCLCTATGDWIECRPNTDTDTAADDADYYSPSSESSFYDDPLGWIAELFGLR